MGEEKDVGLLVFTLYEQKCLYSLFQPTFVLISQSPYQSLKILSNVSVR